MWIVIVAVGLIGVVFFLFRREKGGDGILTVFFFSGF